MKNTKNILLLLLLLLATVPFAHAQDQGYWVLIGTEVNDYPVMKGFNLQPNEKQHGTFTPGHWIKDGCTDENEYIAFLKKRGFEWEWNFLGGDELSWDSFPDTIPYGMEDAVKVPGHAVLNPIRKDSIESYYRQRRDPNPPLCSHLEVVTLSGHIIFFPDTDEEWGTNHMYEVHYPNPNNINANNINDFVFESGWENKWGNGGRFSVHAKDIIPDRNSRMDIFIYDSYSSPLGVYYHYAYCPPENVKEVTTIASGKAGETSGGGNDPGAGSGKGSETDPGSGSGKNSGGDSGRESDLEIPWAFILGAAAVVAGGTAAGVAIGVSSKKKKQRKAKNLVDKGKGKETPKPSEENETPPERHSTFRMVVYKDFGDTLTVGDPPRVVGARIEETTPEGRQIDRDDLTALILINGESNCQVSDVGMKGRYMSGAVAGCHTGRAADEEGVAKVRFVFNGPYGMLVNHMLFHLVDAPEIAMGEGLTFEAEGGKMQYIEFGINNYSGTVLGVQVSIESGGAKYFSSRVVPNDTNPLQYRIEITERGKQPEQPQEQQKKKDRIAGDAECYNCTVTVNLEGREQPVTQTFQLYRMYLGVRMDLMALKGYLVDYDCDYHHEILATDPKRRKKWAESRVTFTLFAENPDTGVVSAVVPDQDPVFTFEDVREGSKVFADRMGRIVEAVCPVMNFKFEFQEVMRGNTVLGVIHSTNGGLYPPNRTKAKVTLRVSYRGRSYDTSEIVTVTSQPYRVIDDEREYARALDDDNRKMEQLLNIRGKIMIDSRFAELAPFYYKIDSMIEGYSDKFGFYQPDFETIQRIYKKYCSGEMGSYFVNEAAWRPAWTEADENFNAFVATFGSIERTWTGLGARIALGIFTAGASELVFTPFSALVKMKEAADKGEGTTAGSFVIACEDILYWEGVFWVAGKAVKWGAGKTKNWLDTSETGKKIKDSVVKGGQELKKAYAELKEAIAGVKSGKAAGQELSNVKNFSTKGLGDKVKDAGQKTLNLKKSSIAKSNEAIRKTRMKGDKVFNQQSQFMEECAQQARKDAQKIFDDFKRVMNEPTATPEEMRRVTLALQGNKTAQNLLRESPSNLLRANFNSELQKIYKDVDEMTIKKLTKRLNLKDGDVKPWTGASANAVDDLYRGEKIATDRDVTFQARGKDGKWVDIDEDLMTSAYCESFNEYHYGFVPANKKEALKTLKKLDNTVVNGLTSPDSYGEDLTNIIVKANQTNKLVNPEKVATTFVHKCKEWLEAGEKIQRRAERLRAMGYVDEAMSVMGYAEAQIGEGLRQNVKEFRRLLDPRIHVAIKNGADPKKFEVLYQKINILDGVSAAPAKGSLRLNSVEEARLVLQDQFGTTFQGVMQDCADLIIEINNSI